MSLHRCTDAECPHVGQQTDKACLCHRTDEQVLTEQRDELLGAACKALNYITNTEGELGITLDSGDALRAAIAKATGAA